MKKSQQQQQREQISLGHYIQRLTIRFRLANDRLLTLANYLGPQLKTLRIYPADNLTDIHLCPVLRQSPQLWSLTIMSNKGMTNESIQTLAQHCPQLEELKLMGCQQLTGDVCMILVYCPLSYFTFSNYETNEVLKKMRTVLELSSTQNTNFDLIIRVLRDGHGDGDGGKPVLWQDLTRLKINGSCGPNEYDTIIPFIKSHPHLNDITLDMCSLTDATLDTISSTLPGVLKRLSVIGNPLLTVNGIRRLILACPLLTEVWLKGTGTQLSDFPELIGVQVPMLIYLD